MNKYKLFASNTILITIGTLGSKILVFLMVRFYTAYLSPGDYGTADLIIQTANLFFPIVSVGITESVFRFSVDDIKERKKIFSAGLYTITAGAIVFFIIAGILNLLPNISVYLWLIAIYTVTACYHALCAQFIRAVGNTRLYAVQGIVNTIIVICLNVLFFAIMNIGLLGYVLSVIIADFLSTLMLIFCTKLWKQVVKPPSKKIFKGMLTYAVPLIPTTIIWWIISVSDRYIIAGFLGNDANGIYAVSTKIPTMLVLFAGVIIEAWQYSSIKETKTINEESIRFFSNTWSFYQGLLFLGGSILIAFSQVEIRLLSTPNYYDAWKYVPVLSMAMVFSAFVSFYGSVYMVKKRSMLIFITAFSGTIVNIVLNLLLIPGPLGIQGAAIATLLSYLLVSVIRAVNSRKHIAFRIYKLRLISNTLIMGLQSLAIIMRIPHWQLVQVISIGLILIINHKPILTLVKKITKSQLSKGRI